MSTKVTRWTRFLGDADQLQVQLTGIDTMLPGATASAKVVDTDDVTTAIAGATVNTTTHVVTVPLTAWLAAGSTKTGRYRLFIVVDGITWPEDGTAEIEVKPNFTPTP